MHKQHRQYVILVVVLLACAASVFFGVRSILHSNDEVTTFAVGDWEGITLPRYNGPTVYTTSQRSMATVTLPMTSTSSRSLFHHSVAPSYRAAVATTQRVQTGNGAYRVYQTSDHEVHSIGSGSGASGTASFGTTNYWQSTPSASFSVPTIALAVPNVRTRTQALALNNINMATTSSVLADAGKSMAPRRAFGPRRINSDGTELFDGKVNPENDAQIWSEYDEGWIPRPVDGAGHPHYSNLVWDNAAGCWRQKSDVPEPDAPIGAIPWLILLLAAAGYGYYVAKRKQTTK